MKWLECNAAEAIIKRAGNTNDGVWIDIKYSVRFADPFESNVVHSFV